MEALLWQKRGIMIEIVARVQEIYPWSEVSRTFCQVKMDER